MNFSISIGDLATYARGLREAPEATQQIVEATMHQATLLLQRETQENIPRVTGITAGSFVPDVFTTPAGVLGVVSSSQPSAVFLELGTKPHMPPVAAMEPWVRAVLGIREPKEVKRVAFLVARKIAKHGTEPQRPLERATLATEGQIVAMFETAAGQIAQLLAGGAAP
ncbi:hypothetical protein ABE501_05400 [Comamonas testosteroni]